jgi:hypothetical protein
MLANSLAPATEKMVPLSGVTTLHRIAYSIKVPIGSLRKAAEALHAIVKSIVAVSSTAVPHHTLIHRNLTFDVAWDRVMGEHRVVYQREGKEARLPVHFSTTPGFEEKMAMQTVRIHFIEWSEGMKVNLQNSDNTQYFHVYQDLVGKSLRVSTERLVPGKHYVLVISANDLDFQRSPVFLFASSAERIQYEAVKKSLRDAQVGSSSSFSCSRISGC